MDQPAMRSDSRLFFESARKIPWRHSCFSGEIVHLHGAIEMRLCPLQNARKSAGLISRNRSHCKLRLSSLAMRRHNQPARDLVRNLRAEIAAHDVQAKINSRCAARRSENRSFIEVEHVRLNLYLRIAG